MKQNEEEIFHDAIESPQANEKDTIPVKSSEINEKLLSKIKRANKFDQLGTKKKPLSAVDIDRASMPPSFKHGDNEISSGASESSDSPSNDSEEESDIPSLDYDTDDATTVTSEQSGQESNHSKASATSKNTFVSHLSSDEEEAKGYKVGGYHRVYIGETYNHGRFCVTKKLGWGHFSTVWLARKRNDGSHVAMKVMKSSKDYTEAAETEVQLLRCIENKREDRNCFVVSLIDSFTHTGPNGTHWCLCFEVLGDNLWTLTKLLNYKGLHISIVQQLSYQIVRAFEFLHERCDIIHTDLKPENVLIAGVRGEFGRKLSTRLPGLKALKELELVEEAARRNKDTDVQTRIEELQQTIEANPVDSKGIITHLNKDIQISKQKRNKLKQKIRKLKQKLESMDLERKPYNSYSLKDIRESSEHKSTSISKDETESYETSNFEQNIDLKVKWSASKANEWLEKFKRLNLANLDLQIPSLDSLSNSEESTEHITAPILTTLVTKIESHEAKNYLNTTGKQKLSQTSLFCTYSQLCTLFQLSKKRSRDNQRLSISNTSASWFLKFKDSYVEIRCSERDPTQIIDKFSKLFEICVHQNPFLFLLTSDDNIYEYKIKYSVKYESEFFEYIESKSNFRFITLPILASVSKTTNLDDLESNVMDTFIDKIAKEYRLRAQDDYFNSSVKVDSLLLCFALDGYISKSFSSFEIRYELRASLLNLDIEVEDMDFSEEIFVLGQQFEFAKEFSKQQKSFFADMTVKVVDFGNGCWTHEHFAEDIQTRQYRAPEAILGAPYHTSADIWSIACLLFELATGDLLFDPKSGQDWSRDEDHIAMILELLSTDILGSTDFVSNGRFLSKCGISRTTAKLKNIKNLKFWGLKDILISKYSFQEEDAKSFADFLSKMLVILPEDRFTARELVEHSWLKTCQSYEQ